MVDRPLRHWKTQIKKHRLNLRQIHGLRFADAFSLLRFPHHRQQLVLHRHCQLPMLLRHYVNAVHLQPLAQTTNLFRKNIACDHREQEWDASLSRRIPFFCLLYSNFSIVMGKFALTSSIVLSSNPPFVEYSTTFFS